MNPEPSAGPFFLVLERPGHNRRVWGPFERRREAWALVRKSNPGRRQTTFTRFGFRIVTNPNGAKQ